MGVIFPLSSGGRIVFVLIAAVLGLIFCMLMWPDKFRWVFKALGKQPPEKPVKPNPPIGGK
jgi:hypothetical protein